MKNNTEQYNVILTLKKMRKRNKQEVSTKQDKQQDNI